MSILVPSEAERHPDRHGLPAWLRFALVASVALAGGVAGLLSARGQLDATTGFLVGASLSGLAVIGLPTLSIRQTARTVLFVTAAVLVRFGLLGSGTTGGGQVLLVYLVAAVAVLVLTGQIAHEATPTVQVADEDPMRRGPAATARTVAMVAGIVVVAALLLGPLILPRVGSATQPGEGASLRSTDGQGPVLRSSDALDMTRRPELTDDPVLSIDADRATYWRGETFDVWDGRRWTRSDSTFRPLLLGDRLQVGEDDLGATGDDVLVQRVRIETSYADVVYAAASAVSVDIDRPVRQRPDGTLQSAPMGRGATYTVTSRRQVLSEERLRSVDRGETPREILDRYAQPPTTTDRVAALAPTLVDGVGTRYDQIKAIETWMGEQVEYSLDAPLAPEGVDVVDHFLFDAEQGWCEQIASSLVVLARANGIPARLVTGFVPDERDPVTGRWIVRARDAHAWAEVWFPEVGWVPFDPTADVPLAGNEPTNQTFLGWILDHLVLIVLAAVAIGLLVGPVRAWWRRRATHRSAAPVGWAAVADARLASEGERLGRARSPSETATAHAAALSWQLGPVVDRAALVDAGRWIDDALYAPRPPTPDQQAAVDALLEGLAAVPVPEPEPAGSGAT
jgi:transglutaminase-like putative cysteine protease